MALKLSGFFGFSNRLNRSSIIETVPPAGSAVSPLGLLLEQLDVQRQALQLLHHHVERLGQAGFKHVLPLDDGLVHAGPACDVVGLDREHLLQRVGRAVGFERPHLHLAEPLAAELRLSAERLLRDQRVGARGAGVDLVVDQMMQLHHVHHAHRHLVSEGLAGATVEEARLAVGRQDGLGEELEDLLFRGAVEDRRRDVDAPRGFAGQLDHVGIVERVDEVAELLRRIQFLQGLTKVDRVRPAVLLDRLADLARQLAAGPAEVRLEDLPDVHAARHAERVEHDVDRRPIGQVRHVLFGQDARQHPLVAVPAGHLVAHLQLTLDGDEHLHHLDDARGQLVAALQALDLVVEQRLDGVDLLEHALDHARQLVLDLPVADLDVAPVVRGNLIEQLGRHLDALLHQHLARVVGQAGAGELAAQQGLHLLLGALADDADLVLLILPQLRDLLVLDRARAVVLLDALAREHARVDDGALDARRHAQARVAHLAGLLAEDGAQELLLGGELGLALRRDLTDQDVARLHLGADADDARFVEILERLVTDVRDVARDLLGSELGVTGHALELLDVDRGEEVVLHDPLGDQDRVLEVVPAPRHEGDQHVAAERQLAHVGGGAVRDDVARLHGVAHDDDGPLVDAGVLVGALVLDQVVDVDAGVTAVGGRLVDLDDDAGGVDLLHHSVAPRHHGDAGVAGHDRLHARPDQRGLGAQEGNGLALHVGAHEGAVGVVVFEERDQAGGHRDQLVRRHVHELDLIGAHHRELAADARRNEVAREVALRVDRRVRLRDGVLLLLEGREVDDLVGDAALLHAPVRRLDEAEVVDPGVGGERRDQADVRAFRRLDGAHPAVVGGVHVAHLEAGALARETARTEGGETALVRDLRQRVRLVHELRELRRPEELLDDRGDGFVVDELLRHQRLDVLQAHALLDGALHADQADAILVLHQLAHRADATVAEVVDVVDLPVAVLQLDQVVHHLKNVLAAQRPLIERNGQLELVVELEASHARQVVALGIEEEVVEERGGGLRGGRITRPEPPVDLENRLLRVGDLVLQQRVAERRADVRVVQEQDLDAVDAALA